MNTLRHLTLALLAALPLAGSAGLAHAEGSDAAASQPAAKAGAKPPVTRAVTATGGATTTTNPTATRPGKTPVTAGGGSAGGDCTNSGTKIGPRLPKCPDPTKPVAVH